MKQSEYPDWFLWLLEHAFGVFLVSGVLLMVGIVGISVYIDDRLDRIEQGYDQLPPSSYEPPNLADFEADPAALDTLPDPQFIYVPAYSHIYYRGGVPYSLETTLSVRNIDVNHPIYVSSIEYFNTEGTLVKSYLDRTIKLDPFQTIEFLVKSQDSSGGSGANFLVQWAANEDGVDPLVETVMVGVSGSQSICFARGGVEIPPLAAEDPAE